MYTLHARPGSGSAAIEAVLALTGAPHRIVDVPRGDPHLAKINPLNQVPVLILPDGTAMTESAAMLIHLCDIHPRAKLAPGPEAPERPRYLRWMLFMAANSYMTDLRVYYPERYSTDAGGAAAVKQAALLQMAREWEIFAGALGERPFMVGDAMTAADVYASMLASWNLDVPAFFTKHANVERLYGRVAAVPAIAAAWKRNGMPLPA